MLSIGTNKDNEVYIVNGFSGYKNGERYFKVQSQKTGKVMSVTESTIKTGDFSFTSKAKSEPKLKKTSKKYASSNIDNIKLLSLDMATMKTGYAVHYGENLIEHSYIQASGDIYKRMVFMADEIFKIIEKHDINMVVIEDIFLKTTTGFKDVDTFKKLAGMQFVLACRLHTRKINFQFMTASEWRSACGISANTRGKAKAQAIELGKSFDARSEDDAEATLIGKGWLNKNKKLDI